MTGRNPDLPILDEIGAEFEALVGTAYAAEETPGGVAAGAGGATAGAGGATAGAGGAAAEPHGAAAARPRGADERIRPGDAHPRGLPPDRHAIRRRAPLPASRASRERGTQARRIGRRAAIMLVLICLIGGVAVAALRGGGDSAGPAHTTPALLGRDAGGAWSLSVYRDRGRLCTVFVPRGGELSGSCGAAPGHGRVRAGSAIAAGRRYVFGVAGPEVERAAVALSGAAQGGATARIGAATVRRPVDPDAARDAGLPAGYGWFLLDLGPTRRGDQTAAPAVVTPFTRHGHRAGPPYVDCSLGILSPACRHRIESAARVVRNTAVLWSRVFRPRDCVNPVNI